MLKCVQLTNFKKKVKLHGKSLRKKNLLTKCCQIVVLGRGLVRVIFRVLGSVPKVQKATEGMDVQELGAQKEGEENLNKVSNRLVGSVHMSARISGAAL